MEDKVEHKLELGDKELIFQQRNLAEMANGSCFVRCGGTLVLATVVMSKEEKDLGFFPLTVDYEERYYAAGKILGSRYVRRESRPTDEAILTARLIDRAIRPLFPKELSREIQVVVTCLSWDRENDPDILGLLGSSLALAVSDVPWSGPVAILRVGQVGGQFVLNPTYEQRERSGLDLVLAGVQRSGELLVNMIEAEGQEATEELIMQAYRFALPELKRIVDFQNKIAQKTGRAKIALTMPSQDLELEKEIKDFLGEKLVQTLYVKDKTARSEKVSDPASEAKPSAAGEMRRSLSDLKEDLLYYLESRYPGQGKTKYGRGFFEEQIGALVHEKAIKESLRPDGRSLDQIRDISCEVAFSPMAHGSGIFCRGQTKALSILTLGAPGDVKLIESMEMVGKKRFMHHYNFPPYSTGEVKPLRGPGRRDIGHGMLAEKALLPVVPSFDQFPYAIRIVSEILSSNGSTSMASCSSASLALMDAGVPISSPVAGISVGLMSDPQGNYKLLADIQGPEDHYGDMDFKVAGTKKGVTAAQMDVKIEGISEQIFKEALDLAKKIRLDILDKMAEVLPGPRAKLSPLAPKILTLQINPDKIREVIGPGGKVINKIIQDCGVLIDIEDSGMVFVTAEKEEAASLAIDWIKNIVREVMPGEVLEGKVKRALDFGAFVEILPGQEGMIRLQRAQDLVRVGDRVEVKVVNIDEQGRVNLALIKNYGDGNRRQR